MTADLTKQLNTLLNKRFENLMREFISMRASLTNIQDNICEIEITNGDELPKSIKTNELLKFVYLQTKEGGGIDKKLMAQDKKLAAQAESVQIQILKCKADHSATSKVTRFNKLANTWGRGLYYVAMIITALYLVFKVIPVEVAQGVANSTMKITK